jgi:hypothetical protein
METKWAVENLQTIRNLMERSAVYRRTLAPIMLLAGVSGVAAAAGGLLFHLDSTTGFALLWLIAALIVVAGAFLIARQQAMRDKEPFWSPPTKRVAQAMLPSLTAGMIVGVTFVLGDVDLTLLLPLLWALFYGCALHAAGFFMPRGVRWFGWIYIALAGGGLCYLTAVNPNLDLSGHWVMGFFFGGLQLIYGAYLYLTERKTSSA